MVNEEKKSPAILGVITARGGSKGIPGKNIKELGGKPLIAYSIEAGKKSALITDLIVSTDDAEIARIAEQWGARVPFMRPPELAGDEVSHLPVIQHAIQEMEERMRCRYDYCVILQPTSPLRFVEDIDKTLHKLISSGADSAVTVVKVHSVHPIKIKKLDGDRVLPYVVPEEEGMRRQDFPAAFRRSGAVYAMRRATIMEKNRLYGDYIVGYETPKDRSIDIDEPADMILAEYMLGELRKKGYEL